MKIKQILFAKILVFLFIFLPVGNSFADIFGSDDEKWEKLFTDIKKINTRLVSLETDKLKVLQGVQEDLLRQIEEIRQIIPDLQGAVELNRAETISRVNDANRKLADLEAHLKNEMETSRNIQKQTLGKFLSNVDTKFNGLTGELAKDMEVFSKTNKQNFQDFSAGNRETLNKIVAGLNGQNQSLAKTTAIIKNEMIPAIAEQGKKNREETVAALTKASKNSNEVMVTGFKNNEDTNNKLVAILGKGLEEDLATRGLVDLISKNLDTTNNNLKLTHENITKLGEVLKGRFDAAATDRQNIGTRIDGHAKSTQDNFQAASVDSKNTSLAVQNVATGVTEGLNALRAQNDSVIASAKVLAAHSEQLEQKLDQSLQKVEASQQEVILANQKLAKLIEILKAIALEQGKMDLVLRSQKGVEGAQREVKQALDGLKSAQEENKEAFADLRRKATVNIQHNVDIQKALTKPGGKPSPAPKPAQ